MPPRWWWWWWGKNDCANNQQADHSTTDIHETSNSLFADRQNPETATLLDIDNKQ
jgi:hypothetical protein